MKEKLRLAVREESGDYEEFSPIKLLPALIDLLLVLLLLFGFVYFRYLWTDTQPGEGLVSLRSGTFTVMPEGFATADDGGDTGHFAFSGRFRAKEPRLTINGDAAYYADSTKEISLTKYSLTGGTAYVADVYVSDIAALRTVLADDAYGKGHRESVESMAERSGAVFAMTGDNYSERFGGAVMRNGVLYAREADRDVCVLNWDGTVDLFSPGEFDLPAVMEKGPCQIWSCGPILLDSDGKPAGTYFSDQERPCRRAAMGYYEPGHYCFVILDGRFTLDALAENMSAIGCKSAYALYGGKLAKMRLSFDGTVITTSQEETRSCGDIIILTN